MSEVTEGYGAKCPCGGCEYHEGHAFYTDGPTNDYWGSGLGTAEDKDAPETVVSFCPWCGAKLFAGGKTQAPATEEERRDAKAMEALEGLVKEHMVEIGHLVYESPSQAGRPCFFVGRLRGRGHEASSILADAILAAAKA